MAKSQANIQDTFLNQLRKDSIPVTIYLVNGFQLRGQVRAFDNFTVAFDSDGRQMMVYKHAISTIVPSRPVNLAPRNSRETQQSAGGESDQQPRR